MNKKEKSLAESLKEAVRHLPSGKKEFLLGYAEGVAAMAQRGEAENQNGRDTNKPN